MTGKLNRREYWEKQTVWNLDNGWKARVNYGWYGDSVCQLESPTGYLWQACNGDAGLPGFAKPWIETVVKSCNQTVVRPGFTKTFGKG